MNEEIVGADPRVGPLWPIITIRYQHTASCVAPVRINREMIEAYNLLKQLKNAKKRRRKSRTDNKK